MINIVVLSSYPQVVSISLGSVDDDVWRGKLNSRGHSHYTVEMAADQESFTVIINASRLDMTQKIVRSTAKSGPTRPVAVSK